MGVFPSFHGLCKTVLDSLDKLLCLAIRLGIGGGCDFVLNVPSSCEVFELLCCELGATVWDYAPGHAYICEDFFKMFDDTQWVETAVFWQQGTNWNNQQLEDNVCSLMRTGLDIVVPIWSVVFQCPAGFLSVESLKTLHRFHTCGRSPWCPYLCLASRLSL